MTIFVAGIHGAGKTYSTKLACKNLGLMHATASELIREERGKSSWDSSKIVSEIEQNQQALVSASRRIRETGTTLVLDGHFVLRQAPGKHKKLSTEIFRELNCSSILLIQTPIPEVLERLRVRKDTSWSEEELIIFSETENIHSIDIATALNIPLTVLDARKTEDIEIEIEKYLRAVTTCTDSSTSSL